MLGRKKIFLISVGMIAIAGIMAVGYTWLLSPKESVVHEPSPVIPETVTPSPSSSGIEKQGVFTNREHVVSGRAQLIRGTSGLALRLDGFNTESGPDLRVYLAADENARDFVDLGELKATSGSFNYPIPTGTDVEKYSKVLIWCRLFSVNFGAADLQ